MIRKLVLACPLLLGSQALADQPIEFNRDVRPILSNRCFACHGPDEGSRAAGLRLDDRQAATSLDGGAIVAGRSEKSELIRRIESHDELEVMPPQEHGEPLSQAEIELLRRWIDQGAEYQRHWAFTKLLRPQVPRMGARVPGTGMSGPRSAIDAFIRKKLADEGIVPTEAADVRTLVRRLAFDLTGLPPDPKQVEDYAARPSQRAYADFVEHLLKSPHFGERMAMYWLDLVRYADSLGYHGDQPRSVSPYRDYVIKAFNENKPFDQFTTEQLAGDLLPDATLWQRVASTYNRLNRASGEGGVQPKEYLAKYSADRVRTTGAVWLGTTIGCAECHDHKFDPFTAEDFYHFAAFFADIKEQGIVKSAVHIEKLPVPTPEQTQRLDALTRALEATEKEFQADTPELVAARVEWERELRSDSERWTWLQPTSVESQNGATLGVLDDHSVLASGPNPETDGYLVRGQFLEGDASPLSVDGLIVLRIELLPDKSLPRSGPGRASNGNLVLHAVEMSIDERRVTWQSARASHSQVHHAPEYVINGHKHGWAILPRAGQPSQLVLVGRLSPRDAAPGEGPLDGTSFEIRLRQSHGSGHNLGRFRLAVSNEAETGLVSGNVPDHVWSLVKLSEEERDGSQNQQINEAFRNATPLLQGVRDELARLRKQKKELQASIVTTLATTATDPRTIRVLPRGDWMDDSGDVMVPAFPGFLPQANRDSSQRLTRLDLAHWLTSRDNPLVARTFVNRLWMLMFGSGLARNVDDLGSQGEPPTHPELLDWLAMEFIDSGWDVKHMLRLIVSSETYRQSSRAPETLVSVDPYNRLYARQSRWRLEAEMVRDNALAVSGLLHRQIGGVSAKPYQPAGYWSQLNFPRRSYEHDRGPSQFRRGLYTHWQRTFLHPSLLAFDAPPREECTAQRSRSNTPLQSLVLLNDPTFVEAARSLASAAMGVQTSAFRERLHWVMQRALMREPRADEIPLFEALYNKGLEHYRASPEDIEKLLSIGATPLPDGAASAELAAWTSVARAILNLHESITRY